MPLLRRPHDHHRDLRARLRAKAPAHTGSGGDQDRHVMTRLSDCAAADRRRWFTAGVDPACDVTHNQRTGPLKTARQDHLVRRCRHRGAQLRSLSRHLASRSTLEQGSNPIEPASPPSAPPPAISCLGASRTPARACRASSRRHPRNLPHCRTSVTRRALLQLEVLPPSTLRTSRGPCPLSVGDPVMSEITGYRSLIPGLGVKLSTPFLAGPVVLSAVGALPSA